MRVSVQATIRSDLERIANTNHKALDYCFTMSSHSWTGFVDEEPVCCWGLMPPTLMSDQAYLWLMTTDKVQDYRFVFVRNSQRWVEIMLKTYPLIVGHCAIGAHESMRWLRWLGATFGEPQENKIPFQIRAK